MRRDLVSALFWLAVAIFAAAQGLALKLGSLKQPGSGFFPFWGGVVLGLLSLVLVARSLGRQSAAGPLVRPESSRLLVVAGAVLRFVPFLGGPGFDTVTFTFLPLPPP